MFRFSFTRTLCTLLAVVLCTTLFAPLTTQAFYASANEAVLIEEPVLDDAYIAGDTIRVIAPMAKDAYLAGGEITILAPIGDSLYITGGTVFIDAPVSGDVFVFGGTVKLSRDASVAGSLLVAAGTVSLDAPVTGDAYIFSDQFHAVSGSVGGDIYYNADISESVEILAVSGTRVAALESFRPDISDKQIFSFLAISSAVYFATRYITLFILTLFTFFVLHRLVVDSATYLRKRYWHNFIFGIIALFFGWVAALIMLPFSLSLSLWLFVSWLVFAVFLAKVFVASYLTYTTVTYLKLTHKLAQAGIAAIVSLVVITLYLVTPVNLITTVFLFAPLLGALTTVKMLVIRDYLSGKHTLKFK